ncbi:hypothetical protein CEUSTIGMA_g5036.t1 [Chlamydomonas eustigma]|uniref:Uncharacterized protein n=1 Tax=Chlamydomonas eustigma TaxID=1157962 RepID=A0A250X3X0_9CHLO|nr:hypothetical protein CEUSTIGMA_g5036.t1 [Chlamydomonas eustigma]|eukprot:GAX77592.1 hypothetical protein CEUSTIGMA_g5036.t1 [Chlamydomonas eustigma]
MLQPGPNRSVKDTYQSHQPVIWGLAAELAQGSAVGSPDFTTVQQNISQQQASQLSSLEPCSQQQQLSGQARPAPSGPNAIPYQNQSSAAFGLHSTRNHPQTSQRISTSGAPLRSLPGNEDEIPYGLVLELAQGGPINPMYLQPPTTAASLPQRVIPRPTKRALNTQMMQAALPPGAIPQQQPGLGTQTLQPAFAGIIPAEEEPDYGIVAELKQVGPLNPKAHDFGLAAEVARRRGGSSIPTGGRYGSTGGSSLPPLRPRKRLAASGPPADFGMSQELAEMQAQMERDRADPFSAANRASAQDPFVMADDLVKFPTKSFEVQEPQEQELVEGSVPLKVPEHNQAVTHAVSQDGQIYGLASELGAEDVQDQQAAAALAAQGAQQEGSAPTAEEMQEMQRQNLQELLDWEPPGDKFVYNEETGMLHTVEGAHGTGERIAREYIEDGATGYFYKLNDPGVWRKITKLFKGKPGQEEDEFKLDHDKGFRAFLKVFFFQVSNIYSMFGIFFQALLGGFSLLNFFATYILNSNLSQSQYLQYYSPLATYFARVYYTLTTFSVIAATAKFCHDQLNGFQPRRLRLQYVDGFQIICYILAYIFSVLCVPLDDQLTYEYNRNPLYYQLTLSTQFKHRQALWQTFNLFRIIFSGLGLLLLCFQCSPYVFMHTVNYEMREKLKEILEPTLKFDPTMAMVPPTPPVLRRRTANFGDITDKS